jgi:hypothetical protein
MWARLFTNLSISMTAADSGVPPQYMNCFLGGVWGAKSCVAVRHNPSNVTRSATFCMSPPKGSALFLRPAGLGGLASTSSSEVESLSDDESLVRSLPLLVRLLADLCLLADLLEPFA